MLKSGLTNTDKRRRAMYDLWKKNWNGVQERFERIRNGHKDQVKVWGFLKFMYTYSVIRRLFRLEMHHKP